MMRAAIVRAPISRRFISTTPAFRKTAAETAQDTAQSVNKKVGDAGVAGIEKGQQATQKAKEAMGLGAKEAQGKASEVAGSAKGTASELSGKAEGKAEELKGKAKGTAEEVKGKL